MTRIRRRTLLRSIGGLALVAPYLASLEKPVSAAEIPRRLVLFYSDNGTIPEAFDPIAVGNDITFPVGGILEPLEAFKDRLIVIRGLDNQAAINSGNGGGGHASGTGCLWTGTELSATEVCDVDCAGWGGGIPVDRYIANELAAGTMFSSLEFGVQVSSAPVLAVGKHMSYDGDAQPVTPEDDPQAMFTRLFAQFLTDPEELERLKAERRTVLDAVQAEMEGLTLRVAADDRIKLDQHLTAVRELEARLEATATLGGACQVPVLNAPPGHFENNNFPAVGAAQMELLAMALACDMTRVASIMWSSAGSRTVHSWLGSTSSHHTLSHQDTLPGPREELIAINRWYAEQFKYLLELLSQKLEPDGSSLLDHTLVVWANPLSLGSAHSRANLPIVLAGACGGAIDTATGGRFLHYQSARKHNDLLVTLCQAMGLPDTVFGNPAHCAGALEDVLA